MIAINKFNTSLLTIAWISLLIATPYQNMISQDRIDSERTLDAKQESIVLISAHTAKGNQEELNSAIRNGLDVGLTINEVKEIMIHAYAYAGFPRSLNGLSVFIQVLKDREQSGTKDLLGRDAGFVGENKNKIELGTEIQTKLVGAPVRGEVYTFAPVIDRFLKEHLLAEMF